jgi:hypothetical protein
MAIEILRCYAVYVGCFYRQLESGGWCDWSLVLGNQKRFVGLLESLFCYWVMEVEKQARQYTYNVNLRRLSSLVKCSAFLTIAD